jgi:hypothetical protein
MTIFFFNFNIQFKFILFYYFQFGPQLIIPNSYAAMPTRAKLNNNSGKSLLNHIHIIDFSVITLLLLHKQKEKIVK